MNIFHNQWKIVLVLVYEVQALSKKNLLTKGSERINDFNGNFILFKIKMKNAFSYVATTLVINDSMYNVIFSVNIL